MLEIKEIYGLVVLDRREAIIVLLKGKAILSIVEFHSQHPGKTIIGERTIADFRMKMEKIEVEHYKKVSGYMKDKFLPMGNSLKGIIIGGPKTATTDFLNKGDLTTDVADKIISVKELSYTGILGLQELLDKSHDLLEICWGDIYSPPSY